MPWSRRLRWMLLAMAFFFLAWSLLASPSPWTVAGFFACGAGWYWLTRRKTRELDSHRPR